MTELLDLVDDLTLPEHQHLAQKDDQGRWLKAVTVTHPPLLDRMREAVFPSTEKNGGSVSAAHTRSPADLDAMFQFAKMASAIGDWCRIAGIGATREPGRDLRRWYASRLADVDRDDTFYRGQLRSWIGVIRNHLDPPESFTIRHACPICSTVAYGDAVNGGDGYPIQVRYRKDETDSMVDEVATCRACGVSWLGHAALMELAEEVHERAAAS